jgi:hypothetical protein
MRSRCSAYAAASGDSSLSLARVWPTAVRLRPADPVVLRRPILVVASDQFDRAVDELADLGVLDVVERGVLDLALRDLQAGPLHRLLRALQDEPDALVACLIEEGAIGDLATLSEHGVGQDPGPLVIVHYGPITHLEAVDVESARAEVDRLPKAPGANCLQILDAHGNVVSHRMLNPESGEDAWK